MSTTCHWLLLVDELSIPEFSLAIPKPFVNLISNLKRNRDHAKTAVITGNIGSKAPIDFFESLVEQEHLHIIRGTLPYPAKSTLSFSISGLRFAVIHRHIVKILPTPQPNVLLFSPRLSSFFPKEDIDVVILGGLSEPLTAISNEGHLVLSPGPITGKCPFASLAAMQQHKNLNTEPTNSETEPKTTTSPDDADVKPSPPPGYEDEVVQRPSTPTKLDQEETTPENCWQQRNSEGIMAPTFMLANVEPSQLKVFIYSLGGDDKTVRVKEVQIPRSGPQG